ATAPRPWAEGRTVAMTSTTLMIPSGRTDLSFHVGGEQVKVYISAPSSEKWNDDVRPRPPRTQLRCHLAPRRLVDRPRPHGAGPRQLRRLRDMGGLGQPLLRMGAVPLPVLLTADPDDLVAALSRIPDPDFSRRLSRHLLLLSQSLLPGLLPRSGCLRRRRAAPRLQG